MQILGLINDDFLLNEESNFTPEVNELDSAVESLESTFAAQKLMDAYRVFKEDGKADLALTEVKKTLTSFVMHDLGLESNNQTLTEVTAAFGCTPQSLGLEAEEVEAEGDGQPSRGRRLLNSIKSAGVATGQGIKSGWNKMVESVKSLLGLNMIAAKAFEQIEARSQEALTKLNNVKDSAILQDVSVSGVDVNEFDGAIAHYKELIATLGKINKAKNGDASTVVNAIFGSLPKLLGIDSNGEQELLQAAKQLRSSAKEKSVNVKHKIVYTGAEGLKAIKTAVTKLQKLGAAMKTTENFNDLVKSLKTMKKGLSKEDLAKLKIVVKVASLYVKSSSDVLRSLVKGVDNLLKVSKSFEKLTGKAKAKETVAATESYSALDVIARLQDMAAGIESFEDDVVTVKEDEYASFEDGLETVMCMLDEFDQIEASMESFVDDAVMEAIEPQVEKLHTYAASIGIEAEDATFDLMRNMSLGIEFSAGIEAEEAKKDDKSLYQKVKDKAKAAWEWVCKKFRQLWNYLLSKFRIFATIENKFINFKNFVKEKAKKLGLKVKEFLMQIPGVPALVETIVRKYNATRVAIAYMKAFFKDPKKYMESREAYKKFLSSLTNEETLLKDIKNSADLEKKTDDLFDDFDSNSDYEKFIDLLPEKLKSIKVDLDAKSLLDKWEKIASMYATYEDRKDDNGKDIKMPDKSMIANGLARITEFFTGLKTSLLNGLASLVETVKGWFKKKEDKKEEPKKDK